MNLFRSLFNCSIIVSIMNLFINFSYLVILYKFLYFVLSIIRYELQHGCFSKACFPSSHLWVIKISQRYIILASGNRRFQSPDICSGWIFLKKYFFFNVVTVCARANGFKLFHSFLACLARLSIGLYIYFSDPISACFHTVLL